MSDKTEVTINSVDKWTIDSVWRWRSGPVILVGDTEKGEFKAITKLEFIPLAYLYVLAFPFALVYQVMKKFIMTVFRIGK